MTQIAIGSGAKSVDIWCEVLEECPNGRIRFAVYNGGWRGSILNGRLSVEGTGQIHDAEILWRGKAPFHPDDYNAAMDWIEQQIGAAADKCEPLGRESELRPGFYEDDME